MEKEGPLPPCAFGCKQVSHKSGIYSDCPGIIEPDFLEGKVIFICLHCKCSSPPLICHHCRSIYGGSKKICIFCEKPGIASTIRQPNFKDLAPVRICCMVSRPKRNNFILKK